MTNSRFARLIVAATLVASCHSTLAQSVSVDITKGVVSKFIKRDRAVATLFKCADGQLNTCSVTCSSGGSAFIQAKNVQQAFYSERKNNINGAVNGYYLVIDVDGPGGKDIWATLQLESSCLFNGLTPQL